MSSRYIEVPAAALLAVIDGIGAAVIKHGGACNELHFGNEIVIALQPARRQTEVRIFTSIARGSDSARGCGEDAIRLFWGFNRVVDGKQPVFKPLSAARRVFRTAPAGEPAARLQAFLDRFQHAVRDVYSEAVRAPRCPKCGAPLIERNGRNGAFMGCAAYPGCTVTQPTPGPRTPWVRGPKRHYAGLPGHNVVARYGMPNGELAREQVEDGLNAELDGATFFDTTPLNPHDGGSVIAALLRRDRRGGYR